MDSPAELLRKRLTDLRLKKGVSEYRMSTDLGQSRGYIQQISSGRSLPSMQVFFSICEYFGVTPMEFFDPKDRDPGLTRELVGCVKGMGEADMKLLLDVARRFKRGSQG